MIGLQRVSPRTNAVHRPPRPGRSDPLLSGQPRPPVALLGDAAALVRWGRRWSGVQAAAAIALATFAAAWFAAALVMGAAHG